MGIGVIFTPVGALSIGEWQIVPAGILTGIMASVVASKVHDREKDLAGEPPIG